MELIEARRRAEDAQHLNAFISLTDENGRGPAVAVKDLLDVRGAVTTAGSSSLPATPAIRDAVAVANMRRAGCGVVGKANLHEWALGATSENRHYGPVRNPHDQLRMAGGSSGGSAAAVAANLCDWAIGTDTAGSIRIPAALCGVFGLRPSVNLVSREGVFPLSQTMDTVGPLANDLQTLADGLSALTGLPSQSRLDDVAGDFRLVYPRGWVQGLDEAVSTRWQWASSIAKEVEFPARDEMTACATTIVMAEAAQLHRKRMMSNPESFDSGALADLQLGLGIDGSEYRRALKRRVEFIANIGSVLEGADAIILPATAQTAPKIGEPNVREPLNRFTRPLSVLDGPMIAVPLPEDGLPAAVQLVGRSGSDWRLLEIASGLVMHWDER